MKKERYLMIFAVGTLLFSGCGKPDYSQPYVNEERTASPEETTEAEIISPETSKTEPVSGADVSVTPTEEREAAASVELNTYMGQPISAVLTDFDNMQDIGCTDGSLGYSNGAVTFEAREEIVTFISIDGDCDYTLEGISYGSERDFALQLLTSAGWTQTEGAETFFHFKRGDAEELSLYLEDGLHVSAISSFGPMASQTSA